MAKGMPQNGQGASLRARRAWASGQGQWTLEGDRLVELTDDWARHIHPGAPTAMCRTCGKILPATCFRPISDRGSMVGLRPDCHACEYDIREAYRRDHIWEERARAVLRHHMRIERRQGLHGCQSLPEYELFTGVTVTWLADKMRRDWETAACEHCESAGFEARWTTLCPHPEEPGGLSRMTVDRTDPSRPLSRDNLTTMCLIGNVGKNDTDPVTYNDRQRHWRLRNATRHAA